MKNIYKVLEYMTIGSSLHDEFGNICYVNPVFCKLFKTSNKNLVSSKLKKENLGIDIDSDIDFIERININYKKISNLTIKIIVDNKPLWLKVNSITIKNGKDFYILTYENITDSMNYSFLYEQIFNNIQTGIIILSSNNGKDFFIKDINPFGSGADGIQKSSVVNKNIKDDDLNIPIIRSKEVRNNIKEVWRTNRGKEFKFVKCQIKDNCWRNIYLHKVDTNEIIILFDDISEIVLSKKKLEQSDKLKSVFLSNMSHEIRSPINAIVGFSDLLETVRDKETQKEYIDIIKHSSKSLMKLIDDILDMSKIEAGKLSITKSLFSVKYIMDEIYTTNISETNNDVTLNYIPNTSDVKLYNDEYRLRQILNNLISNAIKFTEHGSIDLYYNIDDEYITFTVKDTGIGIKDIDKDKVFNRFQKLKTKSKIGTGLGLSISNELCKLMGGELWFESEYGVGSEFHFKLPNKVKKDTIQHSTITDIDVDIMDIDLSDKKILIVEDIEFNTKLLVSYLEPTNVKILTAVNGNDALIMYHDNKNDLDLILMDIQIPEMSGTEVTQLIRTIDTEIPIIAQTAYAMREEVEDIKQNGFTDLIKKPIRKEELFTVIKKYL